MTKLNKSQTEVFEIIKSELDPLTIYDITAKVSYKKNTVNNCLCILEKKGLIWGFERWGMMYYLEGNPQY